MVHADEYGSLHNSVLDRQTVSVLDGKWSEEGSGRPGPMPNGPSAVIVDCPIPNRQLQMVFVEGNQEIQTLARKTAAQSLAY